MSDNYGDTPRDQQNRQRYTLMLALWALVYLLCTYLITVTLADSLWRWIFALTPSLFAILAASAYWQFLKHADELTRTIELNALALAIAVGFVIWPAASLLAESGLSAVSIVNPVVLIMAACYSFAVIKGRRDYQ